VVRDHASQDFWTMKVKITMKDGVRQGQHINPKNSEKYREKYPDLEVLNGNRS